MRTRCLRISSGNFSEGEAVVDVGAALVPELFFERFAQGLDGPRAKFGVPAEVPDGSLG